MYQNNKNVFSFFAVLFAAGLLTSVCGLLWFLADGASRRLTADEAIPPSASASESSRGSEPIGQSGIARAASGDRSPSADLTAASSDLPRSAAQASPNASSTTLGAHASTVLSVATAAGPARLTIASGSYDNTVKLWDGESQYSVRSLSHSGRVNDVAFMPDGKRLVTGSGDGEIKLWDSLSGELVKSISGDSGRIVSLAVDSDNKSVASGSSNGTIKIWDITRENPGIGARTLVQVGPQVNALAFHPTDGNLLISGHQDGTLRVWDLQRNSAVLTLEGGAERLASVAISDDGQYVASGSYDKTIRVWNLATGDLIQALEGHDLAVADVAFSPDGTLLASGSYDESIKTWDWAEARELCTLSGHAGYVYAVSFARSGSTLVSGGYDGTVRTWDLTAPSNQACTPQQQPGQQPVQAGRESQNARAISVSQ